MEGGVVRPGVHHRRRLADELGVAKTTLHHHFVILRSAGLVRVRTSDHRYRLREETFSDVSDLLGAYLKREPL